MNEPSLATQTKSPPGIDTDGVDRKIFFRRNLETLDDLFIERIDISIKMFTYSDNLIRESPQFLHRHLTF